MTTVRNQNIVFNSYLGSDFSLSLDGKLACNLENTTILNSLPTTPSSAKGTYIFSDGNGSTKILNASGSNDKASISLDICSSISAPYNVLLADKAGIIAKSLMAKSGIVTSQLTHDSLLFDGLNYRNVIDTNTSNLLSVNNVKIPAIYDRIELEKNIVSQLDIKINTIESLASLHTIQISNLTAFDISELVKHSQLENIDLILQQRLNVLESKQPLIISVPIYHVPSVYADSSGRADYIPSSVSSITPYSGLYYKNELNQKINWYIQPDLNLTVLDLKGLMLNFYNVSATTGLGCPFFNVYTKTDTITPNSASWYKSRRTYQVEYTLPVSINTSYSLLVNLKGITYDPLAYGHKTINSSSIPENDKGLFEDSEKVLFFSISTSSNSQAGLFEFIASKFTILTNKYSQEFAFQQL